MKLYHSPLSPYVRKVVVTATELGLMDRIEVASIASTPLDTDPGLIQDNPVGRIPALVTAEHGTLMDSRVICRYLNSLAGGSLHGSGDGEWPIIAREALAEGMIDSALLCAYEGRFREENMRNQAWVDAQRAKVLRGCQGFEARIGEMGGELTIDKIALGCAMGYIDFRLADLGWRDSCPNLSKWAEEFSARPSMQATAPQA